MLHSCPPLSSPHFSWLFFIVLTNCAFINFSYHVKYSNAQLMIKIDQFDYILKLKCFKYKVKFKTLFILITKFEWISFQDINAYYDLEFIYYFEHKLILVIRFYKIVRVDQQAFYQGVLEGLMEKKMGYVEGWYLESLQITICMYLIYWFLFPLNIKRSFLFK
jgi:hypothetical protein